MFSVIRKVSNFKHKKIIKACFRDKIKAKAALLIYVEDIFLKT